MTRLPLFASALLASSLVGCTWAPTQNPVHAAAATLVLTPRYLSAGQSVQGAVPTLTRQDIAHLVLQVYRMDSLNELPVTTTGGVLLRLDLPRAELDSPITLSNLLPHTVYRVRAQAYRAAGVAPADLISTQGAGSYVDVSVDSEDHPTMSPLTVRLDATPFAASAAVGIAASGSVLFSSVIVGLYGLNGAAEILVATQSLRADEIPTTLAFADLQGRTSYRVKLQAYDLAGMALSGATGSLEFAVGDDPALAPMAMTFAVP